MRNAAFEQFNRPATNTLARVRLLRVAIPVYNRGDVALRIRPEMMRFFDDQQGWAAYAVLHACEMPPALRSQQTVKC